MTRVADTSALYALFDADDAHHADARSAMTDPTPVAVPSEVLVETINLIEYRFGWTAASQALDRLLAKPHVAVAQSVPMEGVRGVFGRARGSLSLADAIVVQTCRVLGAAPLAFDEAILEHAV